MRFTRTHDDRMRALRSRLEKTPPNLEEVSRDHDAPVQLTRALIDTAIAASTDKAARLNLLPAREQVRLDDRTPSRRPVGQSGQTDQQLSWQRRTQGSMKAFLAHARIVQRLPSFASSQPARGTNKRVRE